jgi:2,3-bisphosphoglycerate-independent phosphoglycerate mutase
MSGKRVPKDGTARFTESNGARGMLGTVIGVNVLETAIKIILK